MPTKINIDELHKYEKSKHGDYCVCGREMIHELHEVIKPKPKKKKKTKSKAIKPKQKKVEKKQEESKGSAGRPNIDIDEYFTKIERYLAVGYTLYRACKLGGVPYSTVRDYCEEDEGFREKIDSLINSPNVKARQVWIEKINAGDYGAAKDWLERRERSDFATRQEKTGADGEPLPAMKVVFVDDDEE